MWHTMPIEEIKRKLKGNFDYGLTQEEALKRMQEKGKNQLNESKNLFFFNWHTPP